METTTKRLTWGEVVLIEDRLRPLIQQTLNHDRIPLYTVDDILREVYAQQRQIWIISANDNIMGFVGTKIAIYPQARVFTMDLAATTPGWDMDWDTMVAEFRAFAEDNNCTVAYIYGREGWKKKMKQYGFEVDGITMRTLV